MANIRDIKNRIVSVKNTKQITNAMKMVAASKLRKAQERIVNARPYADYIDMMTRTVKFKNPNTDNPLLSATGHQHINVINDNGNNNEDGDIDSIADNSKKTALIVITADRGLCGSFNSNIIRAATKYLEKNNNVDLICIGKKGHDQLKKKTDRIKDKYINFFNEMDFTLSRDISRQVLKLYLEKGYRRIDVIYNEFKSAIQQNIIDRQLLPIAPIESDVISETDFLYEPDEDTIINELGEKYVDVEIWRMLLESSAAEQGARMTAMDNATENALELIDELTLLHNRARQASITTEIIEIASGAEAISD